jgi:hypothetical protein
MNEPETGTREFMEVGLRIYVAALATLKSFKIETVKGCRTVMEEQLPTLSRSLGVTVKKADIFEEVLPRDINKFGADWAWIGVSIALIPAKLWFAVGIYIDETGESRERVRANAGFYTARRDTMRSLFRSLAGLRGRAFVPDDEEYGVLAVEPIQEDTLASYQKALRKAVQRWLDADGDKPLSNVAKEMGLRGRRAARRAGQTRLDRRPTRSLP